MKISTKLAQNIVKEMMKVIPYNVNVMNEDGVIIGSGENKRIGNVHEGAVEAIKIKKRIIILEKGKSSEQGVNEPIFYDDEIIGVVGITGPTEEICRFSKLVRATAVLLIEQAKKMKERQREEKKLEEFLYTLVYGKSAYTDEFYTLASTYNIDLTKNYYCILLHFKSEEKVERLISKVIPREIHFLRLDFERIVLIVSEDENREDLLMNLKKLKEITNIGVGNFTAPFNASYESAHHSIEIGRKLTDTKRVFVYDDWSFLIGLEHVERENHVEIIRSLEKAGGKLDLVKTLQVFIDENGEMNETSKRLHIHRNTLNYRLDKISEVTGKHPKNILELFELVVGVVWQ